MSMLIPASVEFPSLSLLEILVVIAVAIQQSLLLFLGIDPRQRVLLLFFGLRKFT